MLIPPGGPSGPSVAIAPRAGPPAKGPPPSWRNRLDCSEIKFVDIILGEGEGLAEQDVVPRDRDRAEAAGLERRVARLEVALGQRPRGQDGQVAQVGRVPEH